MPHSVEERKFVAHPVFQAFVARRADRDQIVQPVGGRGRSKKPDGRFVMHVQLPAQRLFGNPAIPAAKAVAFSRQRSLHLPVSTPVFRASPQNQTVPDFRKYRRPRVEAGFAAEVKPHLPAGKPVRDAERVPALFAADRDLLSLIRPLSIRKTQLQLIRENRNAASHVSVPEVNPHLANPRSNNRKYE